MILILVAMKCVFRSLTILGISMLTGLSGATLVANFDDLTEGQVFDQFMNGGVRFYDVMRHQTPYTNFAIEEATDGFLGGSQTLPNVLGFGGYVPGSGVAFGAFGAMWFTSDTEALTGGLDVYTLPLDMGGNTLTLTGYMDSTVVNSVSHTFGSSFVSQHYRFDLPEDTYTSFRLSSSGPSVMGDSFIDVDNVTVAAVPEPASVAALGLGVLALIRKRCAR